MQRKNRKSKSSAKDIPASSLPSSLRDSTNTAVDDSATSTEAVPSGKGKSENLLQSIRDKVKALYEEVDPITSRFRFKSRPSTAEIFSKPLIVLLGNHSSGKSTFINYVLRNSARGPYEDIQKTGVAPLDDGFTFISYGESFDEQQYLWVADLRQGPAIVSNTNLPFASLSKFGDQFVNHLRLKLCPVPLLRDVILVDSPGMIDSATEGADRGYDFIKAVRWFAERADFVLVFFDPEKPGTTGESLEVFTKALNGIDHKLVIVFNKVDKFQNISDFSRAYGALCWNLAKVIPFKDIPYIYCTYVPVEATGMRSWSLDEFGRSRDEIINKIAHAPSRHEMDNMLTELKRYCEQLLIHVKVVTAARKQVWWFRLNVWLCLLLLVGALCFLVYCFAPQDYFLWAIPALVLAIGAFVNVKLTARRERRVLRDLPRIFESVHAVELLSSKDQRDELERIWESIQSTTLSVLQRFGVLSFPSVRKPEVAKLEQVIRANVPDLLTRVHKTLVKS